MTTGTLMYVSTLSVLDVVTSTSFSSVNANSMNEASHYAFCFKYRIRHINIPSQSGTVDKNTLALKFCGHGTFVSVATSHWDENRFKTWWVRIYLFLEQKNNRSKTGQGKSWVMLILPHGPAVGGCDMEGYPWDLPGSLWCHCTPHPKSYSLFELLWYKRDKDHTIQQGLCAYCT